MNDLIFPTIALWAPVTERAAALDAWHKAVAAYHADKSDKTLAACHAAAARKNAAPKGDHLLIAGPASPVCPF